MPLARIITDVADDCLELMIQLRARGYQVETVSPSAIPSTPADLEVRLEECAPEDVVIHASNGVSAEDLWVYVAPGALDANALPIRTIPLPTRSTSEPPTSPKILSMTSKQKTEPLPVIGGLAIDSHLEDPILAELHGVPMGQVPVAPPEQVSAILVEIPDLVRPSVLLVPKAPVPVENEQPIKVSPEKPLSDATPVKWLLDPEKKKVDSSQSFSIPIAPEPVRAKIALPSQSLRRPARRKIRWNFQPLQVACGLAMLSFLGWTLMLIGRPEAVATQKAVPPPVPASQTTAVATKGSATTSPAHPAPQEKAPKPTPAKVERAAAPARAMPASTPDATAGTSKPLKVHHDDGLIAADTVVFYDGRRPGPPRAKVQPEPSVKHYSDQN
jgi:hypothetical protein